jgi:ABC-type transport system involved in cytochrome c biogenesis permease subunit
MGLGFVLFTLGVIAGSTWAFMSLKDNWIRQPSIVISFFTWGVYLAMICLRVTAGWRGRRAAIMTLTVIGFSVITWAAHARLGTILFNQ